MKTDPGKLNALKTWSVPTNKKELRSFLGFAVYYHRFVEGYAKIAKPLNDLLAGHGTNHKSRRRKNPQPFTWGELHQQAFTTLIEKLTSPLVLGYADYKLPFILNIDASGDGLGAVLYQLQDGRERVIAYASRGLRALHISWSFCAWNGLSVINFLTTFTVMSFRSERTIAL